MESQHERAALSRARPRPHASSLLRMAARCFSCARRSRASAATGADFVVLLSPEGMPRRRCSSTAADVHGRRPRGEPALGHPRLGERRHLPRGGPDIAAGCGARRYPRARHHADGSLRARISRSRRTSPARRASSCSARSFQETHHACGRIRSWGASAPRHGSRLAGGRQAAAGAPFARLHQTRLDVVACRSALHGHLVLPAVQAPLSLDRPVGEGRGAHLCRRAGSPGRHARCSAYRFARTGRSCPASCCRSLMEALDLRDDLTWLGYLRWDGQPEGRREHQCRCRS